MVISYEEAAARIQPRSVSLSREQSALQNAAGRFLAANVLARLDSPPFDNSAVDGFALGPGPSPFRVVSEVAAGCSPSLLLGPGEAARVYTGSKVPEGTAAVAMVEDCTLELHAGAETVHVAESGDHVRRQGEDYRRDDHLAASGDLVSPALAGLLASAGVDTVDVHRLPRVMVLTTGDEVKPVGSILEPGQIYNSNAPALAAAIGALGLKPTIRHIDDDVEQTRIAVGELVQDVDVLITCGGISLGGRDHLKEAFAAAGVEEVFWKAAIKPGKPLWFGTRGQTLVFGLPGNPVSSLITFFLFVRPALLSMMGSRSAWSGAFQAFLTNSVTKKAGRTDFMRGNLTNSSGRLQVGPARGQSSHMLMGMGHADCLIVFPAQSERMEAGEIVDVMPVRWGLL